MPPRNPNAETRATLTIRLVAAELFVVNIPVVFARNSRLIKKTGGSLSYFCVSFLSSWLRLKPRWVCGIHAD